MSVAVSARRAEFESPAAGGRLPALGRTQRLLATVLAVELLASAVLVAVMAVGSPINAHPDEMLHLTAGLYFREHWLPPPVGAADGAPSYSEWGFSYLDEADIVYLAFGKVAALGEAFGLTPPLAMRWFQVLLYWSLIGWMMARARTFTPALAFLLLTPQVWYVFSYINADALPFAILTVLLTELAWSDSGIRAFLRGERPLPTQVVVFGGLLGLLVLSKRNYLVSLGFLGGVFLWLGNDVRHWKRAAAIVLIAAAVALPWVTYHAWVNDWETGQRVDEYAERVAAPNLKPSGLGVNPFPFIAMRAKGVSLWAVLTTLNWPGLSFRSFCGLYGWMRIVAAPWVYGVFSILYASLLAILVLPVLLRGTRRSQLLLLGVLIFGGVVLGQSVYRSWVYNFQGQGRYLFPVLPMLFFYWRVSEAPSLRVGTLLVAALLGMHSIVSFALVGLAALI
jgi:uncharacterized membrane protein